MRRGARAGQSDAFDYQDIIHAFGIVGSHSSLQLLAMLLGLARGMTEAVLLRKLYYLVERGGVARSGRGRGATFALRAWPARDDTVARKKDRSAEPWDGRWHLLTYDVPTAQDSLRRRLRRFLHEAGFGLLCASSWVSPYDWEESLSEMFQDNDRGISACYLHADGVLPLGGETDPHSSRMWKLESVADRYLRIAKRCRAATASTAVAAARTRSRTCLAVMRELRQLEIEDPMLPDDILLQPWPRPAAMDAIERLKTILRQDLQ